MGRRSPRKPARKPPARPAPAAVKPKIQAAVPNIPSPADIGSRVGGLINPNDDPRQHGLTIRYKEQLADDRFSDESTYLFDEVAPWWREACSTLPCFARIKWPGYDTYVLPRHLERTGAVEFMQGERGSPISTMPVMGTHNLVIQLWKGWCAHRWQAFPGGIGAEVGVYFQEPNRPWVPTQVAVGMTPHKTDLLWWPCLNRTFRIRFDLLLKNTDVVLFSADSSETWWRTKWMDPPEYDRLRARHPGMSIPDKKDSSNGLTLRYWIDNERYPDW